MPNKEKINTPSKNPQPKRRYKVTNWTEYNKSLKNRGKLSLYFPAGDMKFHLVNENHYTPGVSGQSVFYKPSYVELMYITYRLFGWGMRQICGYFEDMWERQNLDIQAPSFGHLSDLFASLPIKIKQFSETLKKRIERGESVTLILDTTGIRFGNSKQWYEQKYGKAPGKRLWRKMHLAMDPEFNNHAIEITDHTVADSAELEALIECGLNVDRVVADGGYYSIQKVQELSEKGIIPVIPPDRNAVIHGKEHTTWHDTIVQYIKEKGTIYAFHKKYEYGMRSRVEAQFSRIKRCIGESFQTQKLESQKNEGIIIGNILNLWNSFGMCKSVKVG